MHLRYRTILLARSTESGTTAVDDPTQVEGFRNPPSARAGGRSSWRVCAFGATAILLAGGAAAFSADVAAGRVKAKQCQACHGLDGLSKMPQAPNIAGQPEGYLVKSMNEFRKGVRKDEMMSAVAEDLTDQDVANLAAYYAGIKISAQPPK